MKRTPAFFSCLIFVFIFLSCQRSSIPDLSASPNDLVFDELAQTWDEGIPLGNAVIGTLIWEKENKMRLSLDRVDLWDLRPSEYLSGPEYSFEWIYDQVKKKDYRPVQQRFDAPYDQLPAPSKIPGAGLEFPLAQAGQPESVRLYLNEATCEIRWANGMTMQSFVHANRPVGWFRVENAPLDFIPELIPPLYQSEDAGADATSVVGLDLQRLGYRQGTVVEEENRIIYRQPGWGNFSYEVIVEWKKEGDILTGVWSISTTLSDENAAEEVSKAWERGLQADFRTHIQWWKDFWGQSSVSLPDPLLAKQYANEMYKLGSAAREDSYPISLQAVWTADNGKLPPWKGDYHHDLNTQLSYWPCYIGNQLQVGLGYLNTLWDQRDVHRNYTKEFFGLEGLNVPGVCTLTGEAMGGWVQYSMSPTIAAWLAQHFYLHYKYSADRQFLETRAYPYLKETAVFLEEFSYIGADGLRTFPLSSSPEIFDNSLQAWFTTMTNYDLGLSRFVFCAASELATDLGLQEEAVHWKKIEQQFPDYDLDETGGLTFAKGFPYDQSHRHFSNAMAFHPLSLIDYSNGEKDQQIIDATIAKLDQVGPDYWCGYSYSWLGNMKARAQDGEGAAEALRIFAECFCLKNTFHANGDQTKSGKSRFSYRPFTLEGNFAFASGIQEMLLQSHTGTVCLFPAIPADWKNVSFDQLRAFGAFLVSAHMTDGEVSEVKVFSEKGGMFRMKNPFGNNLFTSKEPSGQLKSNEDIIEYYMEPGDTIYLKVANK